MSSVVTVASSNPPITARPERRVLLGALADAQRHRQHAENHGGRRHQHRTQPRVAGRKRRRSRALPFHSFVIGEDHH